MKEITKYKLRVFKSPTVFALMNHMIDDTLDSLLNQYMDTGILYIKYTSIYRFEILFRNNKQANMWNANEYYGWLSSGDIGGYKWSDARPRKSTMRRLRDKIKEYHINNNK